MWAYTSRSAILTAIVISVLKVGGTDAEAGATVKRADSLPIQLGYPVAYEVIGTDEQFDYMTEWLYRQADDCTSDWFYCWDAFIWFGLADCTHPGSFEVKCVVTYFGNFEDDEGNLIPAPPPEEPTAQYVVPNLDKPSEYSLNPNGPVAEAGGNNIPTAEDLNGAPGITVSFKLTAGGLPVGPYMRLHAQEQHTNRVYQGQPRQDSPWDPEGADERFKLVYHEIDQCLYIEDFKHVVGTGFPGFPPTGYSWASYTQENRIT